MGVAAILSRPLPIDAKVPERGRVARATRPGGLFVQTGSHTDHLYSLMA
jgi:hypothetical protein